jgi:hypothetical protein
MAMEQLALLSAYPQPVVVEAAHLEILGHQVQ